MVLIKEIDMPDGCNKCYMSKTIGIIHSYEDRQQNEKWLYCDISKKHLREFNLMKDEYPPRPSWCPLVEVEQYGPEGTLYKEK